MSRYPWRDTSEDIAKQSGSQWETPAGAQEKADKALTDAKEYTDEQNQNFNEHIEDTVIHVTQDDKDRWNNHILDNVRHVTPAEHTKLTNIQDGAEVNQNAFAVIKSPGRNDVNAKLKQDSLNLVGGTGIAITTNEVTNAVTFSATGEALPGPHGGSHNIIDGSDPIPDLVQLREDFDNLTPSEIGAETPAGAQEKVDISKASIETMVGDVDELETTDKSNLVAAVNEVFTSVGNGKTLIADAITDKGVPTSATDTFAQMAENIGDIKSGGTVKGVQRGQYNFSSASTSAKIPISSIVPENSIVTITVQSSGTEARNSMIMAEITSATELTLSKVTGHSNTDFVWWEVVEYESVKSLQKFTGEVPTASLSISPVDPTKTIVFGSRKTNSTLASIGSVVRSKYYLRNGNAVEVTPVLSATIETYHIQVVEFE